MDEVQRIMRYIRQAPNQTQKRGRQYLFMEDELFDLTSMAMEYFKEHIEPTLPEITYFGADFLDFTSTFASNAMTTQNLEQNLQLFFFFQLQPKEGPWVEVPAF